MSILIKGMELPKSDCVVTLKLYGDGRVIITREQRPGLVFTGMNEIVGTAIELPPHGRLIDADELEIHDAWISEAEGSSTHITFVYANDISEAPTVIEAEAKHG